MTTGPTLSAEYRTLTALQVRIDTHARHSEHRDNPIAEVIAALDLTGEQTLADIGCGDARFLAQLAETSCCSRLVGVDTSPAMVAAADAVPGVEAFLGDAQQLPFTDGEFDRTTARHMLYHVPEPLRALREFRRITRPGGLVVVTVNHPGTAARTRQLIVDHAQRYGLAPAEELSNSVNSQTLPSMMTEVFDEVAIGQIDNALVFEQPEPLIRWAEALFSFCGIAPDSPHRTWIQQAVAADISRWFAANPGQVWRDPKGYIVATATV